MHFHQGMNLFFFKYKVSEFKSIICIFFKYEIIKMDQKRFLTIFFLISILSFQETILQ